MNASSPYKNEELTSALNSCSEIDAPRGGGATELKAGFNDDRDSSSRDARLGELSSLVSSQQQEISQLEARLAEQGRAAASSQLIQLQVEKSRLELRVRQLETAGGQNSAGGTEQRALQARCDRLTQERDAVQTIMEHKVLIHTCIHTYAPACSAAPPLLFINEIMPYYATLCYQINVLVQSISHAVAMTLQASPQGGGEVGQSLSRDVSALQRLVNASVIALRNAAAAPGK